MAELATPALAPGAAPAGDADDVAARRERLVELYREASGCLRCPLSQGRTKVVFGAGDANADLAFVGEAPGAQEDLQGLPFVGRAGGLLNELLGEIGLRREDVFVMNVLKCRPPGNRDPLPLEIESCRPYLERQIELIQPRVIATLGNFATKLLSGNPTGITRVHGRPQAHRIAGRDVYLMPLFHPAAALRTPSLVETLRADIARLPALLESDPPEAGPPQTDGGPEDEVPAGQRLQRPASGAGHDARDQLDLFG